MGPVILRTPRTPDGPLRVAQSIVLMCQKFKSCYFPLIFPFLMIKYPSDSNFSSLGEDLDMDQGTFVFTK